MQGTPGTPCSMSVLSGVTLMVDTRDRTRLRKAVRFAMRLADEFAGPEVGYPLINFRISHSAPCVLLWRQRLCKLSLVTLALFLVHKTEYIKRLVTGSYDPAGTCRMRLTKEEGVVDQSLKVLIKQLILHDKLSAPFRNHINGRRDRSTSTPRKHSSFLQSYLDIAVDRSSIHSVNHFLAYSA
jgi:hypothetical protein